MNIIVSFLAILELMKTGEIWAEQDGNENDIILYTEHLEERIGNDQDESDN